MRKLHNTFLNNQWVKGEIARETRYLVTLAGNLGMIMLIRTNPHLQTPMYFFLSHLSFVDLCYSSNVTPNMLHNFLSDQKTISYAGCFTQCLLFIALVKCLCTGVKSRDQKRGEKPEVWGSGIRGKGGRAEAAGSRSTSA